MTTWTQLSSAAEIHALLAAFRGFHDGALRGMRISTGGQIGLDPADFAPREDAESTQRSPRTS